MKTLTRLERAYAISKKSIGIALLLVGVVLYNYEFLQRVDTASASVYLKLGLTLLICSIAAGIMHAVADSIDVSNTQTSKQAATYGKDGRILWIQFGSLLVSVVCLSFTLADAI